MKLKHLTETFTTFKPQVLIKVNLGCIAITKADKIQELTPKQQMSLLENINFLSGFDLDDGNLKVKKKVFVLKKKADILNAFYHDDGVYNTHFKAINKTKRDLYLSGCAKMTAGHPSAWYGVKGMASITAKSQTQTESYHEYEMERYEHIRGKIMLSDIVEVNEDVVNYFNKVPINYNNIVEFFETYGHMVIDEVSVGGFIFSENTQTISKEAYANFFEGEVSTSGKPSSAIAEIEIAMSAKAGSKEVNEKINHLVSMNVTCKANSTDFSNPAEWIAKLPDSKYWTIVRYDICKGIVDLLPDAIENKS